MAKKNDDEAAVTWKRIKKFKNPKWKGPCVSFHFQDKRHHGIADVSVLHSYVGPAAARIIKADLAKGKRKGAVYFMQKG